MSVLAYLGISIVGLLAGTIAGDVSGLSLGWLLAFSYHRHGPSDPGEAPVYVTIGLTVVGACVGAVAGLIIGIVYSVRLAKRHKGSSSVRPA